MPHHIAHKESHAHNAAIGKSWPRHYNQHRRSEHSDEMTGFTSKSSSREIDLMSIPPASSSPATPFPLAQQWTVEPNFDEQVVLPRHVYEELMNEHIQLQLNQRAMEMQNRAPNAAVETHMHRVMEHYQPQRGPLKSLSSNNFSKSKEHHSQNTAREIDLMDTNAVTKVVETFKSSLSKAAGKTP